LSEFSFLEVNQVQIQGSSEAFEVAAFAALQKGFLLRFTHVTAAMAAPGPELPIGSGQSIAAFDREAVKNCSI
jgi:hypothetical protein